jgi:hypothetical protein
VDLGLSRTAGNEARVERIALVRENLGGESGVEGVRLRALLRNYRYLGEVAAELVTVGQEINLGLGKKCF